MPPEGVVGPGAVPTDVRSGTEPEPPLSGTERVSPREESVAGDVPPRTEPSLVAREGVEEAPPPRTQERPSGREGTTPPTTEDVSPRTEEPTPPIREGAGREQEEDRGLLDRARDALLGEEEESPRRREEGTDRPDRR